MEHVIQQNEEIFRKAVIQMEEKQMMLQDARKTIQQKEQATEDLRKENQAYESALEENKEIISKQKKEKYYLAQDIIKLCNCIHQIKCGIIDIVKIFRTSRLARECQTKE